MSGWIITAYLTVATLLSGIISESLQCNFEAGETVYTEGALMFIASLLWPGSLLVIFIYKMQVDFSEL